jgi:hypothetical protein
MNTKCKLLICVAGLLSASSGMLNAQTAQNFYPGGFAELRRDRVLPNKDARGDREANGARINAEDQHTNTRTAQMGPPDPTGRKAAQNLIHRKPDPAFPFGAPD